MGFKKRIIAKLTRISHKNPLLRLPMLAVIFVFLAVCHFFSFINRNKYKIIFVFVAFIFSFLSCSYTLYSLLPGTESKASIMYESSLDEMMRTGDLEILKAAEDEAEESENEDDSFTDENGNENYSLDDIDTYSLEEVILAGEELLASMEDEGETYENQKTSFSKEDWELILVNKQHPIPDDYSFNLATIKGSMKCDERILADLLSMLKAAAKDNVSLVICSPYRESSTQVRLFERKINKYMGSGLSYVDAYKMSSQWVTVPGTSEHQIGLCLDIYSSTYKTLNSGFGETVAGKWLRDHSHEYGFILRYPLGKEYITGIEYEPWHFRYVGKDAAKIIFEENITLEEFWDLYVR